MTLAELFRELANRQYFLELDQAGGLVIGGICPADEALTVPPYLRAVIVAQKEEIKRMVGAFPGQRWPSWAPDENRSTNYTSTRGIHPQATTAARKRASSVQMGKTSKRNPARSHATTTHAARGEPRDPDIARAK